MADKTQVPGMENNYFESQNKEPRRSSEPFGNPGVHNMGGEGTRIPMSNGGAQDAAAWHRARQEQAAGGIPIFRFPHCIR